MLICGRPATFGDAEQIEVIHQERQRLQRLKSCEEEGVEVPEKAYTDMYAYKEFIDAEFKHDYSVAITYKMQDKKTFDVRAETEDEAEEIAEEMFEEWAANEFDFEVDVDYIRASICA